MKREYADCGHCDERIIRLPGGAWEHLFDPRTDWEHTPEPATDVFDEQGIYVGSPSPESRIEFQDPLPVDPGTPQLSRYRWADVVDIDRDIL